MQRLLLSAVALAAVLVPTASAEAQVAWIPCMSPAGFECGTLDVPVDRAGSLPGTVTLSAVRVRAASNPRAAALVPLAGGPGQAAVPIAKEFGRLLRAGLTDRDLLVFDQRGTGQSNPLRCAALSGGGSLEAVTHKCALQLGPARAFFRTPESVADLEALRVAAGYERLALYGVSYGTKVALAYAAAHPDRVERLVLDSVVLPEGPDALRRSTLRAAPRALAELCAGGRCRDAARDLAKVAAKLRRRTLRGPVFDGDGRRRTATLSENGLVDVVVGSDLDPAARSELPAALRSALLGDQRPLLRLSARVAGLRNGSQDLVDQADDSTALQFTTTCEENPTFPFDRAAGLAGRRAQARAAVAAQPAGASGPFAPATMLDGVVPLCINWPFASAPPDPPGPLPAVPTLVLNGRGDTRTPVEDARQLAARIPGTSIVELPFTGHSVLGIDLSGCAGAAVAAFFADRPPSGCGAIGPLFPVTGKAPTSVARTRPYPRVAGRAGRTLEALRLTVNDARRQVLGASLAHGHEPSAVGGLRGGRVVVRRTSLVLRDAQYVPGVLVSGSVPDRGTAALRVSGAQAARGSIRVTRTGRVTGRLGGRRLTAKFASNARAGTGGWRAPLTRREARVRGRVARAVTGQ